MSEVQLDFKIIANQATSQLKTLNDSVKSVGESVDTTRLAFANMVGNAALSAIKTAASAIASSFGAMVGEAQRLELVTKQFETLTGSAEKAKIMVAEIKKAAASTPFEVSGLQNASKMLLATGTAFDQVIPKIRLLGDVASTGKADIEGLTQVYAKISGQGRVTAETFETLLNQAPIMGEALAKAAGVSGIGALRLEMEKGKVTADVFNKALVQATSEGGKAFNAMATQMNTYSGITSNLSDTITNLSGSIGNQLLPVMKVLAKSAIDAIDANTNSWIMWAQEGVLSAIDAIIAFIPYINATLTTFKLLGDAVILTKDAILTGFWAIEAALAGLLYSIVSGVEALVSALPDNIVPDGWKENLAIAKEAMGATYVEMGDKTAEAAESMQQHFANVNNSFKDTVSQEGLDTLKGRLEEAKVAVQESTAQIIADKEAQQEAANNKEEEVDKEALAKKLEREKKLAEDLAAARQEQELLLEEERLAKEEAELVRTDERFAKMVETLGLENALKIQAAQNLQKSEGEIALMRTKAENDQSKARIKALDDESKEKQKIQEKQAKQFELTEKAKLQWDKSTWMERADQTRAGLQALSGLQNSSNSAMFAVGKSAAIANATVQTYQAATAAYASLAGIPIVGPALGAAAAAAAIVSGMANVAKISSQKPPEKSTFAEGGIVGGNSFSGDKLPVFVNSGEMILNQRQQANLLNQVSGEDTGGNSILNAITELGNRIASMEIVVKTSDYEIGRSVNRAIGDGLVLQSA